ncbi:MAG: nucleotide sugar dehydrogenase [Acidobacteria bacterium]|nr:nucleotide sugar dehydrogenase [Acidobacteriota bacterium]
MDRRKSIGVVGLGYVGLPLAIHLGRVFSVVGFDINHAKIERLKRGIDDTGECQPKDLAETTVEFTSDIRQLATTQLIIIAVPTPVDDSHRPDLSPLQKASEAVGSVLQKGSIVVYESTVYPGVTEDFCGPILEKVSGLKCGTDFFLGYSPERINPGDKKHSFEKITKVVSGQTPEVAQFLADIYGSVVEAGTFLAKDIRTAEAAKVIENTQRDINIALMNELAIIFERMGVDTKSVLEAARTKWNFLPFSPGLVGGHCIGVDPYYLTHAAEKAGYYPQVILSGRRINDEMGNFVARQTLKRMIQNEINILNARVLVCGMTFKENVPDLRNSKVIDIVRGLQEFGVNPVIHDPLAAPGEALHEYGVQLINGPLPGDKFEAIILAVAHNQYAEQGLDQWEARLVENGVFIDVKGLYEPSQNCPKKIAYWRL